MFLILLLGVAVVSFLIWLMRSDAKLEKERAEEQRHNEWKRQWDERSKAYDLAKEAVLSEMEAKWGKCTKDIFIGYSDTFTLEDRVFAFEEAGKIVLGGSVYDFKDIIGFSLRDNTKTIYTAYTTGWTKKNPGDMVAKGVAGKIIAGDIGAAIGAMSAEDDYDCTTEYDYEEENEYKVYVNVDSISSPTVSMKINNEDDAYETANLLNVIIRRNSRQS